MCNCKNNNQCTVTTVDVNDFLSMVFEVVDCNVNKEDKHIGQNIDLDKEITKVIFSNPATIVFWKDGTKTVSQCQKGDVFNKETGLAMCIVRKLTGNKRYNEVFEKYCN